MNTLAIQNKQPQAQPLPALLTQLGENEICSLPKLEQRMLSAMGRADLPRVGDMECSRQEFVGNEVIGKLCKVSGVSLPTNERDLEELQDEVIRFIKNYYPDFTPNELFMAIEMNAAGKFKQTYTNYGKPLNCELLGQILTAYRQERSRVTSKALRMLPQPELSQEEKLDLKEKAMQMNHQRIEQDVKEGKFPMDYNARMMFREYYEAKGLIVLDKKAKQDYFNTAKAQIAAELEDSQNNLPARKLIPSMKFLNALMGGDLDDEQTNVVRDRAAMLAIVDYIKRI
jgi:hypothetical protein